MRPWIVRDGDYLTKIAYACGASADDVWNHADNATLKQLRVSPEILQPGDVVYVPETKPTRWSVQPGDTATFTTTVPKVSLDLTLHQDGEGDTNALAGMKYRVEGLPGAPVEGAIGDDGSVSFHAPIHIVQVLLIVDEIGLAYPVRIGFMDPVKEPSGLRKRLAHLGYFHDDQDGNNADDLRAALRAFQRDQGIEPTGVPDDATVKALLDAHGS